MSGITQSASRGVALAALACLSACATFTPGTLDQLPIRERAQTIEQEGLRVSVAVLSRDEAKYLFGANLHERGVQPVWLEIENRTDEPLWFMLHGLDPNYFSAHEVAYMNHKAFSSKANKEMDRHFSALGIKQSIGPGITRSGFAFSNETIGAKEVRVRLFAESDVKNFEFFVSVPGLVSDWDRRNLAALYSETEIVQTETEEQLLAALSALPCCVQREYGDFGGLPLNVILIGNAETLRALVRAGWDETAFLLNLRNLFDANYLYGRTPDVQFSKTRRRIDSTNLLRLWATPLRFKGQTVAVGSIKRNIDPDIDEAALYLLEDLATSGTVKRYGFLDTLTKVPPDTPRRLLGGDVYWTTGKRVVIQLSDDLTPLDALNAFGWGWEQKTIAVDTPSQPDSVASP